MSFSWVNLPKPIVGLSAMDGVTDSAMREITKRIGNPDFMVTEFTSSEGLSHGVSKLLRDFHYTSTQRPVIAQIFGSHPESFYTAAAIACFLGFDGIDINMGCPADSAAKKGGGAALIQTPELAKDIVRHVKRAVTDWSNGLELDDLRLPEVFAKKIHDRLILNSQFSILHSHSPLPVSVKTRIGYEKPVTLEWTKHLLEVEPAVITFHGRTLEQHYGGEANWEEITRAAEFAHQQTNKTLLFGNGDIQSMDDMKKRVHESGVDGVWIGRAAMGNPWIFTGGEPTWEERKSALLEHARIFEELNRTVFVDDPYPFLNMRKHMGWYVRGIPNAAALRQQLYQTNSVEEVEKILDTIVILSTPV